DFVSLRFDNERYGYEAAQQLAAEATGPRAEVIKADATQALAMKSRPQRVETAGFTPQALSAALTVGPAGSQLPERFLTQDWSKAQEDAGELARCLEAKDQHCDAILVDVDGDGAAEIVVADPRFGRTAVFTGAAGVWRVMGHVIIPSGCTEVRDALRQG